MKFSDDENECGDLENMPLENKINSDSFEEKFEFGKRVYNYRFYNISSLILLVLSYFSIWFFFFYHYDIIAFFKLFKPKIHHFRLNYIVFYFIWGFIITTSNIVMLIRLIQIKTEEYEDWKEIVCVIENQFGISYSFGNIFFVLYIYVNVHNNYKSFGISCFCIISATVFYFLCYIKYYKAKHSPNLLSFISFKLNISFLFSWSLCLSMISIFNCLEVYENHYLTHSFLENLAIIFHFFLICFISLLLSYFYDIYSCFLILTFQIGIVIRHQNLKSVGNQITLILCIYSAISLVYSITFERKNFYLQFINKEEMKCFYKDYKWNRQDHSFYQDTYKLK